MEGPQVPHVSIVYYSGHGHTAKQADAVAEGARERAEVSVFRIDDEGSWPDDMFDVLERSDAIVFGSPTYMAGPAWQFKKFADASSKPWSEQKWRDKVAAGFTISAATNGDKGETLDYFFQLSQQHGQVWVGLGVLPANSKDDTPADLNWVGGFSGAMAIAASDASPDEAPAQGFLDTARHLGRRVAEWAGRIG
jgi:NAD(P)H dehydrogenase (quinone)